MDVLHKPRNRSLHRAFLAILPRIVLHARIYFRDQRNPDQLEELIAEVAGLAWLRYIRLVRRGKNVNEFASTFASYVARAVRSGRRVCGQQPARDAMSPLAQQRHRFAVQHLPDVVPLGDNPVTEALMENIRTSPADQATFRVDFKAWLQTRTARDRRVIRHLMKSETTAAVAIRLGLTPSRVSQLRREFHEDWRQYQGDAVEDACSATRTGSPNS